MSSFKEPSLVDRQNAAVRAKKAALDKFRAKPEPDAQQIADRKALAAERVAAKQARDVEKAEKKARDAELAEHAARAAAAKVASDLSEQAAHETAQQAGRKAARDARYAARKARQK